MEGWELTWKVVFWVGITLFAGLAVWVTVAGFTDIKKMLRSLSEQHERDDQE